MNWWDQGYWIVQTARRVPVSQSHARRRADAAQFLTATDEAEALAMLDGRSRALRDRRLGAAVSRRRRRLAGRPLPESRRLGRHPDVALLLAVFLAARPTPIRGSRPGFFARPTTRSMAYRLMVLGGAAARAGEQHLRRRDPRAHRHDRPPVLRGRRTAGSTRPPKKPRRRRSNAAQDSRRSG